MIYVTGATGYVGSWLVRRLLSRGQGVRCLVLPGDPAAAALEALGAEVVHGDVADLDSLLAQGSQIVAVVHAAALMLPNPAAAITRINVNGTANVLAFARHWGIRRFVYLSAVSAVYRRRNVYGRSKEAAEALVRDSGLEYTILRPTMVYGPGGGLHFQKLVSLVDRLPFFFPVLGPGTARVQPVWIEDLVSAIELVLDSRAALGKSYGVSGATPVPFRALIDAVAACRGKRLVRVHVPLSACMLAARLLAPVLGERSFLSPDALHGINEDAALDYAGLATDCGYRPRSLQEGLAALAG